MKEIKVCTGQIALVDDDIHELFTDEFWHYDGAKVFRCRGAGKSESLHRLIKGSPVCRKLVIDHIDRDPLNNLRSNLRFATAQQNSFNRAGGNHQKSTSKYKGVSRVRGKWRSSISLDGKKYHMGYHDNEADAAREYNKKAIELFGEFAFLNTIEGDDA